MKKAFLIILNIMLLNCSNKEQKKEIVVNETTTKPINNNFEEISNKSKVQSNDVLSIADFTETEFAISLIFFQESEKTFLNINENYLNVNWDYTIQDESINSNNVLLFKNSSEHIILIPTFSEEFPTFQMVGISKNKEFIDYGEHTYSLNDLLGNWEIKSNAENSNTFSLILLKNPKGSLEGFYCAVVRNGNKIDCSPNKEINIKEIKKQNNEYLVSFKSFFGAVNGEAKISLINGKLHWQVIKKPIGEFYCPLDVYLIKKDNDGTSSNNAGKINLNDENYKGEDITMQVYKDIIEYYGCGDYSVNGISLGKYNDFEIFIVENNCGDFPFKDLISVKNGKIADKLLIESSSFDIEKSEIHNIKDQTDFTFDIINFSNIQVKENHTINNKVQSNKVKKYFLDNNGKFLEK